MTDAGIGAFDSAEGNYGFKATPDGKVSLGNTSDDVIQVTGSFEIKNDTNPHIRLVHTEATEYADIKSDGLGNMILNPVAEKIKIQRGGTDVLEIFSKPTVVYIGGKQQGIDVNFTINNAGEDVSVLNLDAANSMANITKFLSYQTVSYDLGSGTTSTITPTSSCHYLTAQSITGDMGMHLVSLAEGQTSGQILQLIMGTDTNNINIMFDTSNIMGSWTGGIGILADAKGAALTFMCAPGGWVLLNTNALAVAS